MNTVDVTNPAARYERLFGPRRTVRYVFRFGDVTIEMPVAALPRVEAKSRPAQPRLPAPSPTP